MGEPIPSHKKKFNTELTDFSVSHAERTGPYADDLEVDALVVGAGFGAYSTDCCLLLSRFHLVLL